VESPEGVFGCPVVWMVGVEQTQAKPQVGRQVMTKGKNFSGQSTPSIIDDTYYRCNFTQPQPIFHRDGSAHGVRLFPGDDTPRSFLECNLTNCEIPPGSTVEECNTAVVSRHQAIATEEVIVDGRTVVRTTKEGNVVHGHYDEDGNLIRP
jgi:hypothetical protein